MNDRFISTMVSVYTLAYHSEHYSHPIFDDFAASSMLSSEECKQIAANLVAGKRSVNPDSEGAEDDLRKIINTYFSPSVLTSAAVSEAMMESYSDKVMQIVLIGSGYGTFSCRQPIWSADKSIFELEESAVVFDKRRRISNAGLTLPLNVHFVYCSQDMTQCPEFLATNYAFNKNEPTFFHVPFVTTAFSKEELSLFLLKLEPFISKGSYVLLEYAKPPAPDGYNESELCGMLGYYGLRPIEIIPYENIVEDYFEAFNAEYPDTPILPAINIGYCLAEKI